MRSPQQKMNYIIQQLNKSKKSGGVFVLEDNMEILSNKISFVYPCQYKNW